MGLQAHQKKALTTLTSLVELIRDATAKAIVHLANKVPVRVRGAAWRDFRELASKIRARDELTGMLTRREFQRRANRRLKMKPEAALVFFDVDRLASVNYALGHKVTDACIIAIARTVEQMAAGCMTARFGGDEFIVLVDGGKRAEDIAERTRDAVRQQFCAERTQTMAKTAHLPGPVLTVSAACTFVRPGQPLSQLFQRCDTAIFEAKLAGRDCLRWA